MPQSQADRHPPYGMDPGREAVMPLTSEPAPTRPLTAAEEVQLQVQISQHWPLAFEAVSVPERVAYRRAMGLTVNELAHIVNVPPSFVKLAERVESPGWEDRTIALRSFYALAASRATRSLPKASGHKPRLNQSDKRDLEMS